MTIMHNVVIFKIFLYGLGWTFPNLTENTNSLKDRNFFPLPQRVHHRDHSLW